MKGKGSLQLLCAALSVREVVCCNRRYWQQLESKQEHGLLPWLAWSRRPNSRYSLLFVSYSSASLEVIVSHLQNVLKKRGISTFHIYHARGTDLETSFSEHLLLLSIVKEQCRSLNRFRFLEAIDKQAHH